MIGLFLLKRKPDDPLPTMAAARDLLSGKSAIEPPTVASPPAEPLPLPPVVPPVVPPTGDIVTRWGNPPLVVSDAIKRHWPQRLWVDAAEVSYFESGWSNTAENNTLSKGPCGTRYWYSDAVGWAQTEDSIGLFQINICAHGGTREHWHDPDVNAAKGAELFASAGWAPWTVTARRLGLL